MKRLVILIPLLFISLFSQAQSNADSLFIKKISDEIMRNGKAYDLLYELTKKIGGRLAGSAQQQNAAIWGKRNLEALGADKVFMQPCKTPNWKRGGNDFAAIVGVHGESHIQPLAALALGNSMGSNGLLEAELVAVASMEELERRQQEVKGKIVYFHSVFDPTKIQTFRAYGESGIFRRSGASRAAKYGAIGVMIHSLSTAPDNAPHTGSMTYDEAYPKIPAVALGPNDAKMLYELAKKGSVRVQMQTHGYFLPDADENNVVAELRGSEFPDEYITLGGHLDSWDVNEGAHDDGAGIVQTMEVLRVMKALNYKPVGFIDDDPSKLGYKIQGVPVLGSRDQIKSLVRAQNIEEVIIAVPSLEAEIFYDIVKICRDCGVAYRRMKGILDEEGIIGDFGKSKNN